MPLKLRGGADAAASIVHVFVRQDRGDENSRKFGVDPGYRQGLPAADSVVMVRAKRRHHYHNTLAFRWMRRLEHLFCFLSICCLTRTVEGGLQQLDQYPKAVSRGCPRQALLLKASAGFGAGIQK